MHEYHQLQIMLDNGNIMKICGTEDVLRRALFEWENAIESANTNGLLRIDGYTDTADRASCTCLTMIDSINSMFLVRMA